MLYDDSVLALAEVTYGGSLGDPNDPFETDIVTTPAAGSVTLDEFSFLFDFELDALQSASFSLATLVFDAIGVGTSAIEFGFSDFSDAIGNSIFPELVGATVEVVSNEPPPTTIPEPATNTLFLAGLIALLLRRPVVMGFRRLTGLASLSRPWRRGAPA